MMVVSSSKAEQRNSPLDAPNEGRNHARPKAYLALLIPGARGSVDRRFIKRKKEKQQITFAVSPSPGDVYEMRNWWWDAARETFLGGTSYIGFDGDLQPTRLTRDEAFVAVLTPAVSRPCSDVPDTIVAERFLPHGVII